MEHSAKFELVKSYHARGMWDDFRVRAAVGRWITPDEAAEILGEAAQDA